MFLTSIGTIVLLIRHARVTETDRWDNKWLSKQRAINKIDAAVALCMAVGAAMAGDTSGSIDDWLKSLAS